MSQVSPQGSLVKPSGWRLWWYAARPKTLPAVLAPLLVGQVLAALHAQQGEFNGWLSIIIVLCGLSLQVAVNLANDVFDFRSGIDGPERVGPPRVLALGWVPLWQMVVALLFALVVALLSGSYLVSLGGSAYLFLGIAALLALLAYSAGPYPLASHALGEVTVFIFFGLVAVVGGFALHHNSMPFIVWLVAVQMGLLTSAIMLVNNIRDHDSDLQADKHTLAVRLGPVRSEGLYRWLMLLPLALQLALVEQMLPDVAMTMAQRLFSTALWALVVVQAVRLSYLIAIRRLHALNKQLAQTAALTLAFAVAASVELVLRYQP